MHRVKGPSLMDDGLNGQTISVLFSFHLKMQTGSISCLLIAVDDQQTTMAVSNDKTVRALCLE